MIDLYAWPTPNGYKISILLEELELPYRVHPVNIGAGEQFHPDFLKISPNNRMPAIVDPEGPEGRPISVFESGAIMIYLAEKAERFIGKTPAERVSVLQWLMWQMGGVGPMFGQAGHFRNYAPEPIPYGIERYTKEAGRLLGVLERRLAEASFMAGDYSIADMATFPWVRIADRVGVPLDGFPLVHKWVETISARPAVVRGLALLSDNVRQGPMKPEEKEVLFGKTQFEKR